MVNILITGIGSSNSISFVKGLRGQNEVKFTIMGTDIYKKEFSPGARFVDRFFEVPTASDKCYIPSLIEICKKNNVDVLVPIIDEEFGVISDARKEFGDIDTRIMLPSQESLITCQDKYKTYLFFKKHNVTTPATYLNPEESEKYPILMKPRSSRGSRDIKVISNKEKADSSQEGKYVFQEIIKGQEYTIDTLSDTNGKSIAAVPRIRLEVKSGVSYKAKTVKNKTLEDICISICETLPLVGPACIQCIITAEGVPYFLEINPRISSAVILTVRAGINIPLLAVKNILGMKLDNMIGEFEDNVIMLRHWEEAFTKE